MSLVALGHLLSSFPVQFRGAMTERESIQVFAKGAESRAALQDNAAHKTRALKSEGGTAVITIPLSTEVFTKVRLAPSPLWETVTSSGVLLHQGRDTVRAPWATRARRVLPGTDLSALVAVMCVAGRCPDFLTPPPDASAAGFEEEHERLRITRPEVVFEEVELLV
jgi:hypothetical protein